MRENSNNSCMQLPLSKMLGEGGGAALEGRVISEYFTNCGGSDLPYTQPGEGPHLPPKEPESQENSSQELPYSDP